MRRSLTLRCLSVLFAFLAVLVPSSAWAAEVRQGNNILVAPGETIDDDLYIFGGTLNVQGTVNGDVVLFAGTSTVSGLITGDLLVLGGTTNVTGEVRGSVRAAGGSVSIAGRVDQDVALAAGTLDIASSARLGRDLLAGVGSAQIAAPIARNVVIGSGDLTLAGPVGGDVRAEAGTVRLSDGASVTGKFTYASERPAEIAPGVVVGGGIERGDSARNPGAGLGGVGGLGGIGPLIWLRGLVGVFFLGLVLVVLAPSTTRRGTAILSRNFGSSLVLGLLLVVGVPILATLVFAFGLLIGGWWLGLGLLCVYALALGLGYAVSAVLLGEAILARAVPGRAHAAWNLLAGVLTLGLLALVPMIGGIVSGVAVIAGVGALGMVAMRGYRGQRHSVMSPAPTAPASPAPAPA
jgi:cytoskeletal protein CcmA (bactofilin family)